MSLRALALAAAVSFGALTASTLALTPVLAQAETAPLTMEELLAATSLDEVFTQFGAGIAAAPKEQGMPFVGAQEAAWQEAVQASFDPDRMHADLARRFSNQFDPEDIEVFGAFYRSEFGEIISTVERAATVMPPDQQMAAREAGMAMAEATDERRKAQIEEMLKLVSADITTAIVRQSVRGMLIGMTLANAGDIEVPWEEIDKHLDTIMPAIEADVQLTQRAMMYFGYASLTEADLDRYLEFLRTNSAQKLYAIAAYSIGEIIAERMKPFGETFARRLAQVSV